MVIMKSEIDVENRAAPTLLIILDGFGLASPKKPGNAITPETAPHIFGYMDEYPTAKLTAHGSAVGLFPGQEGNSEAGHLNIGTGRIVEQDLVRISEAIADGTFYKNEAFKQALFATKKHKAAVHVMGLLTDEQSAHARPEHLYALLDFFRRHDQKEVYIHLFTDGRDASPHAAVKFLHDLRLHMKNGEKIATIMGRFYAMDRNKVWKRTEAAYNAMVMGEGNTAASPEEAINQAYNRGETDEYILPTVIAENGKTVTKMSAHDAVYFFNARSDRARQITKAFVQPHFETHNPGAFSRSSHPAHLGFVAMTDFGPDLAGIFTAFPSPDIDNGLAKAIGDRYDQLYISETEKYAHVTYFINGGYADPINGERRELIRSGTIRSYAERPQMHARELTDKIIEYLKTDKYNFICVNFPNADMVGHTGDLTAAKRAISEIDVAVERLVGTVLGKGGQVIVTADHGNAEEMINEKTGEILTEHTTNPVPFIVLRKGKPIKLRSKGILADVAPTLLKLMNIPQPEEMTGKSLIS